MKTSLLKVVRITVCAAAFVPCLQLWADPSLTSGSYSISFYPGFGATETQSGAISESLQSASWSATGGPGGSVTSSGGGGIFAVATPDLIGIGIPSGTGVSQSAPSKGGFSAATLTISWNATFNTGSQPFVSESLLQDFYQLGLGGNVGPTGSSVSAAGSGTFSDTSGVIAGQWGAAATVTVGFTDSTPGPFGTYLFDGNANLADLPANDNVTLTGDLILTAYDPAGNSGIALTDEAGPVPAPEPSSLAGAALTSAAGLVAYARSRRRK
jgi:hypothetical protein